MYTSTITPPLKTSATSAPASGSRRWLNYLFFFLLASSLAWWWGPLASTFSQASSDERYTHLLIILPITITFILVDWNRDGKRNAAFSGSQAILPAGIMVIAVLLSVIVRWKFHPSSDFRLAANMLALVAWWNASFVLCFGTRAFRRTLFPMLFLLWLVPLPDLVLNPAISLLQQGSAATAHFLFAVAGTPVQQRGMLLHIPKLTLEVAPECSSIRSSLMLVVTTMVLAHLLLQTGWKKALVVAFAIPLSILKNGLRIFVLGILATRVDPSFLTGRLHRQGGVIYFLIALAGIFLLIWWLRRTEVAIPKGEIRTDV